MIPREIRYTLTMFYEYIEEQGSYIDAVECLNELYHYKVYETAERRRINAVLQDNKAGIVKRLLRYMQRYPSDEIAHFIPNTIDALRAFDIDWPDLKVIAKSVPKKKTVAEALGSPLGNIVYGMQNALRQGNDNVVAHRIIDLWRGNVDELQRASEMLLDVKQLLLSWAERHLGSDDSLDVQDGLNLVQVLPPSDDWSDIPLLLAKHKKNIIKYLLKCMEHKEFDIVSYRIPKLRDWGITWPDLEILKPGADELEKKKAHDSQLYEADSRADFSTVFRNRSEEAGGNRFLLTADEYVEHIRTLLQSGYNTNQVTVELATLERRRRDAIRNWPELAAVLNEYKKPLLDIISSEVDKVYFTHRFMSFVGALNVIGVHWPEIKPMIEKNKHKIMRVLLELIKDDADMDFINSQLNSLKSYGVKWPELDIVTKTVEPDELTEEDSRAAKEPFDVRSMIMDMLERDGLGIALYHIEELGLDVDKFPELVDFLNKRKSQYMKIMLKDLKDGRDWKYGAVEQYLRRLEGSKINWPDLKVIRDSLNNIYNPEEDSNAP